MDPVSALVLASVVAWLWSKNVAQDTVYAIRGEEPPSARRERERWEQRNKERAAKGHHPEPRREARVFFGHAWADAWATAEERRARAAEKKRQRRREEWAERDTVDAIEDEAWRANRDRDRRAAEQQPMRCELCDGEFPASELALVAVEGTPTWACPVCAQKARDAYPKAPKDGASPANDGSRPAQTGADPKTDEEDDGTVIQFPERPDPATNPTPIPAAQEETVSGETPNLAAAINFTAGMANSCKQGAADMELQTANAARRADSYKQAVAATEQAISGLQAGGVTGPALSHMMAAQEHLGQAAGLAQSVNAENAATQEHLTEATSSYEAALAELRNHVSVREAYQANRGAGSREFNTQD